MDTTNSIIKLYDLKETDKATTSVYTPKDFVFIKDHEYFKKVRFQNICYLEASGSYCIIHLSDTDTDTITCTRTLSEIVRRFPTTNFVRVHRSFVVNLDHVNQYLGNQLWAGTDAIPIGRLFKKDVLNHLNIIGADVSSS